MIFALPNQGWLDSATLPITLDPDLGYNTVGASATGFSANILYITPKVTADIGGAVESFSAYGEGYNGGGRVTLGLVTVSGKTATVIDDGAGMTVMGSSGVRSWHSQAANNGTSLVAGTDYNLCFVGETASTMRFTYDTVAEPSYYDGCTYVHGDLGAAHLGITTWSTRAWSVYATYSAGQLPIIGNLATTTTPMGAGFSGQLGIGGDMDSSLVKSSMLQKGTQVHQGNLVSAVNRLLPVLAGNAGVAGELGSLLSASILTGQGSLAVQGDLDAGLAPLIIRLLATESQAVFEGDLAAVSGKLDTAIFGTTGMAGDISTQVLAAASLAGQIGVTGSATIRLAGVTAVLEGALGVSGQIETTLYTGMDMLGKLGISGNMEADLAPFGLRLLEIIQSENIYRIIFSSTSGRVVFMEPKFGRVDIQTLD
ncbi:MAG: hypothetical protein MI799_22555 [Desulfobacterales bacterium]|nr:hypothetical protein [Desulfobacterales bacterium]